MQRPTRFLAQFLADLAQLAAVLLGAGAICWAVLWLGSLGL